MELLQKITLLCAICAIATHAVPVPDSWVERGQLKIAGEPDMRVNYELLDSNFDNDKVTLIYRVSMAGPDDKSVPDALRRDDVDTLNLVKRAIDDQEVELRLRGDQFLEPNSNRYSRAVSQSEVQEPLDKVVLMGNDLDHLWRQSENSTEANQVGNCTTSLQANNTTSTPLQANNTASTVSAAK
ncbi:hypothetical protein TTRE_0000084201 [Trichuris trichiura]|uniref:Uncharacterized protein n=1 Tax=Trichuris trichiura TaxID=36087 RepID=A0A077Z1X9_TRITR|nr:hypothetical protein TTRE_0000084201 [Trichuris trichiura]